MNINKLKELCVENAGDKTELINKGFEEIKDVVASLRNKIDFYKSLVEDFELENKVEDILK